MGGSMELGSSKSSMMGPSSPLAASRQRVCSGATPSMASRAPGPPDVSTGVDMPLTTPKSYLVMWRGANGGGFQSESIARQQQGKDIALDSFGTPVAASLPRSLLDKLTEAPPPARTNFRQPEPTSTSQNQLPLGLPLDIEANEPAWFLGRSVSAAPGQPWSKQRPVHALTLPPPGMKGTVGLPAPPPHGQRTPTQRSGSWALGFKASPASPAASTSRTRWSPLAPSGGIHFIPTPLPGQKRRIAVGGAQIVNGSSSAPDLHRTAGTKQSDVRSGSPASALRHSGNESPLAMRVPVVRPLQKRRGSPSQRSRIGAG